MHSQQILHFPALLATLLITLLLASCAPTPVPTPDIDVSPSKADVIASLGEPDGRQAFILPDEPFYGPQESLANLLPSAIVVEEWVYERGDEASYIWFAGEEDEPPEDWRVIAKGSYPLDAVY